MYLFRVSLSLQDKSKRHLFSSFILEQISFYCTCSNRNTELTQVILWSLQCSFLCSAKQAVKQALVHTDGRNRATTCKSKDE